MLPNDISMGAQGHAAEGELLLLVCVVPPIKMLNIHFTDSFKGEKPTKTTTYYCVGPSVYHRARPSGYLLYCSQLGFPVAMLNASELLLHRPYDWESTGRWGMGDL